MHQSSAATLGRFSTGMEKGLPTEQSLSVGRYCDGSNTAMQSASRTIGRFSSGMEISSLLPSHARVGTFADGLAGRTALGRERAAA